MTETIPPRPPVGQRPKRTKEPFGTRRSPLKSSPKRRHIGSADYLRLVEAAKAEQSGRCIGHDLTVEADRKFNGSTDFGDSPRGKK